MGVVRAQRRLDRGVESNGDVVCRVIPAHVDADGLHTKKMNQLPLAMSPAIGASSINPTKQTMNWYGRRESNSRHELGRLLRYHYATPACDALYEMHRLTVKHAQ